MANPNPKTEHLKPTQFKPGQSGNPGGRRRRNERKADRRLVRSILGGWTPAAEDLPRALGRIMKIATSETSSDRDATAAMKALLMAQRLQLATLEMQMKLEEHYDLVGRLKRLEGDDGDGDIRAADHPAGSDPGGGQPDRPDGPGGL